MYIASVRKALWLGSAFYVCICTGIVFGEEITVSYASLTAAYMDHIVAIEKGYVLDEGLNVKIMRAGGGTATQTLLSGQFAFQLVGGLCAQCGSARRSRQNCLHQYVQADLQACFKQA